MSRRKSFRIPCPPVQVTGVWDTHHFIAFNELDESRSLGSFQLVEDTYFQLSGNIDATSQIAAGAVVNYGDRTVNQEQLFVIRP